MGHDTHTHTLHVENKKRHVKNFKLKRNLTQTQSVQNTVVVVGLTDQNNNDKNNFLRIAQIKPILCGGVGQYASHAKKCNLL